MAVVYGAAGSVVYSTGNPSPTYPSGGTASRLYGYLMVVGTKPDTTPASTPSGWTLLGAVAGGEGSTGIDQGPTRLGVFYRESLSILSGSVSVTVTGNNISWAVIHRWECLTTEAFDWGISTGADVAGGTGFSAVTSSVAAGFFATGDGLMVANCFPTDTNPTWGTPTLTAQGGGTITLGTVTVRTTATSSSGQDIGGRVVSAMPTASSVGAGTLTYAATLSGTTTNAHGPVTVIRVRAAIPPPNAPTGLTATGTSTTQIDVSWNSVAGATDYNLERSADGATGWARINGSAPQTGTSYNDTGRTASTTYYYRVSVTTSAGTSAVSSTIPGRTFNVPPYSEDFEEYIGLAVGTWGPDWTISAQSPSTLNSFLLGDVSGWASIYPDDSGAAQGLLKVTTQTDQGVLLLLQLGASAALRVSLRASGGWTAGPPPVNGYYAHLSTTDANTISKMVSSSGSDLTPSGTTWTNPTASTDYKFRMEVVGTTIRTRLWAAAGGEPGTWRTATDVSISSGVLGLSVGSGPGVDISEIEYYVPAGGGGEPASFAAFGVPL